MWSYRNPKAPGSRRSCHARPRTTACPPRAGRRSASPGPRPPNPASSRGGLDSIQYAAFDLLQSRGDGRVPMNVLERAFREGRLILRPQRGIDEILSTAGRGPIADRLRDACGDVRPHREIDPGVSASVVAATSRQRKRVEPPQCPRARHDDLDEWIRAIEAPPF